MKPLNLRIINIFSFVAVPDSFAIVLASLVAYFTRFGSTKIGSPQITLIWEFSYQTFLIALSVGWILALVVSGIYTNQHATITILNLPAIMRPSIFYFLIIGFTSFIFKASVSRIAYLSFFAFGIIFIFIFRVCIYYAVIRPMIYKKKITTKVLVIGLSKTDTDKYADWIMSNPKLGFTIAGKITCNQIDFKWISDFDFRLESSDAQEVLLLPGMDSKDNFSKFIHYLEDLKVHLNWIPHDSGNIGYWQIPRGQEGLPFLTFESSELSVLDRSMKRIFDLVFSSLVILAVTPVMLMISILILLSDGRPIFYSHQRVGRGGKRFKFLKFRTMVNNADQLVVSTKNDLGNNHVLFKNRKDPRVTNVGRFLRKYSLDELPQFFNVLNNTMSVVGPRPALPREVNIYNSIYERRLIAKPGITGPWQISGRSDLDLQTSIALDLNYLTDWSLTRDFAIVLGTISAVVKGKGAY
jgi:exopolysaccharide biosynthesis polyprenyl glycosylphosphotransferase